MSAQKTVEEIWQADRGLEASQRFALHTVRTPARSIWRSGRDPLNEFHHLRLREVLPPRAFERGIQATFSHHA